MDFRNLLKKRYSCRKYSSDPVERKKIDKCIQAARLAPSACNAQPWRFIVFDEKEIKDKVAKAATSGIYRMSKFIRKAPVLIVAGADVKSFASKAGSLVTDTNFYLLDMGIACQNLVLQATEEDLGSCYIGWFNEKKVKKVLGLPKKMRVPLLISIGYPDKSHRKKDPIRRRAGSDNRKDIKEIARYNPRPDKF